MKKSKRKVYIILSYTGTVLSRVIRVYTRAEFAHVSIALDSNLDEMYSFGRLNPYNPFHGGFVHEGVDVGTFKRFKNTVVEIYSLDLNDWQYFKIKRMIKKIESNRKLYKFNTIGLFANGLHIRYRRKYSFYCAEFVKYLTDKASVNLDLPELVKPIDFRLSEKMTLEYKGLLRKYKKETL